MVALYIPNVKLCIGAITIAECCVVDSVEWPRKLKSKLMSLQALETTEGICSQVENSRQSTNESLTQRTRALSFSSTVFCTEVRYGSLHTIRKPEGHRFCHRDLTWVLMVCIMERETVCSFLSFCHIKHSHEILQLKCLIKIKLLIETLVLGGGNRFYFYANKKANYKHEN